MSRDVQFGINIKLGGAQTVTQATNALEQSIRQTEARYRELAASGKLSMKQQAAAAVAMREKVAKSREEIEKLQSTVGNTAVGKYAQNMEARRALGVRSEKDIQKEIAQTEAAYQRLARSGTASARELARAQDASIAKIKTLRKEMGESEKGFSRMQVITGVGLAVGAGMMLKPAITKAVDYDRTVASLTNTMFNDRDKAGRVAGKSEVKQAIQEALKVGGGSREQAAGTLSSLMGSGEFSKEQSYGLLKTIQKGSTATGADSGQLADIVLAAKRMGIKPADMDKVISKAIRAGELGGFELSDMAKHLPAALSSARSLGLSGMGGFERVLASMQASVLTAGTKDEAANNLINILEKMNSADTAKDFQKQGINLRAELVKGAGRGEDTITTFTALIDRVIAKDPKTKAVTQELDRLSKIAEDKKNPQREQALKQIRQIYASGEVGKFLQDRQALQGFRAESQGNKSGLTAAVREGLSRDSNGQELDTSYSVMSDTASAKLQQVENSKLQGQDEMLTGAGSAIKPFFDGLVGVSTEFPVLTASVSAATSALSYLAAAAAANALLNNKGAAGGVIDKIGAGAPGAAKFAGKALAVGAAWELGYDVAGSRVKGGIDSLVQSGTGDKNATLGGWIYDLLHSDALKPPEPPKMKADVNLSVTDDRVLVKSMKLDATGMNANLNTGNIFHGAPG